MNQCNNKVNHYPVLSGSRKDKFSKKQKIKFDKKIMQNKNMVIIGCIYMISERCNSCVTGEKRILWTYFFFFVFLDFYPYILETVIIWNLCYFICFCAKLFTDQILRKFWKSQNLWCKVSIRQNQETFIILKHLKYSNFGHASE